MWTLRTAPSCSSESWPWNWAAASDRRLIVIDCNEDYDDGHKGFIYDYHGDDYDNHDEDFGQYQSPEEEGGDDDDDNEDEDEKAANLQMASAVGFPVGFPRGK